MEKSLKVLRIQHSGSRVVGSNNSRRGNLRGRNGRRKVDKSNVQCINCQNLGHFARVQFQQKKPQEDEVRVARQKFDDEKKILVMITEGEYNSTRSWDNLSNLKTLQIHVVTGCVNDVADYILKKMQW